MYTYLQDKFTFTVFVNFLISTEYEIHCLLFIVLNTELSLNEFNSRLVGF